MLGTSAQGRRSVFSSVVTERHILSSKHTAGLSLSLSLSLSQTECLLFCGDRETHIGAASTQQVLCSRADTLVSPGLEECKCGMDLLYFVVVHCPYICVFGALCQEVQFCFHLIQVTVWTQSLLRGQPCLSVSARLYHQLVSAESVSGQRASQFLIWHCEQIFCHTVLSL